MRLRELVAGLTREGADTPGGDVRICDVTEDSRTVVPGSLFLARSGRKADGRRFVADAVSAGAVAIVTDVADVAGAPGVPVVVVRDVAAASGVIAERFYGRPSERLAIAAVTGTNGKTTISFLTWRMLGAIGIRTGLIGTVLVDDGREVARSEMTTPPPFELSRTFASMVEAGCRAAAIEASSHALDQSRIDAARIHVGIFTNLTGDHLDYHGTEQAYGAAKARLFGLLPPEGLAIVNADDAWSDRMLAACRARTLRCSTGAGADAVVTIVNATIRGMTVRLDGPWGQVTGAVPLIGGYNAMNVLQAFAATHEIGRALDAWTAESAAAALAAASAPPGRLQPAPGSGANGAPTVLVDYAHSDDALRSALQAVRTAQATEASGGRLWAVFGCGGERDRTKRPRMGACAASIADRVVVTSDNPRSEQPEAIINEILAGIEGACSDRVTVEPDRAAAIAIAVEGAAPNDVIVIAGKGHETEQLSADEAGRPVSRHFDDIEYAAAALARRSGVATVVRRASSRRGARAG